MSVFYQLLINNVIASITNFTVWFALTYYVYLQTKSVFATSIISGVFLVATAISGFWFGSLVDHNKKKKIMLVSSIVSLFTFTFGFVLYETAPAGSFTEVTSVYLWALIPLLLSGVIVGNIRNIALPTLVTYLIPEDRRDKANGLVGTASGVSFLIVSVISGFLVGHSGLHLALILAIAVTLLTILHLASITFLEKEISNKLEKGKSRLDIKGTLAAVFSIPGLFSLILFTTFNNFLGGVFMSLMDAYGLSLVSVEVWGLLWGGLSLGFIVGGLIIAKWGLGKNPLKALFGANLVIWGICSVFTLQPSLILLISGMFIYLCVVPYIEAAEHTIIQKVVRPERQGRVFGFAQSIEQAASPLTAFAIGPITQFIFIPFMTTGRGVDLIGGWFGVGPNRGIALVFTITGIIGFLVTVLATQSRQYKLLSKIYQK